MSKVNPDDRVPFVNLDHPVVQSLLEKEKKKNTQEDRGLPPGWTLDAVMEEVKECMFGMANTGICYACGDLQEGCEPDAQRYECNSCGERRVYGTEHIFITSA